MRVLVLCLALLPALVAAPPVVEEAPIRAHMAFLADPLLEGRGTGQRGGDLAVKYLEAQLRTLGLKPLVGGGYLQRVEVQGRLRPSGRTWSTLLVVGWPRPISMRRWYLWVTASRPRARGGMTSRA